jgi:hypothetical protein
MPTLGQLHAAMKGFPRRLTWADYSTLSTSPDDDYDAMTVTSFTLKKFFLLGSGTGSIGRRNFRTMVLYVDPIIEVQMNKTLSWALDTEKTPDLLLHEQGHFDITGLVARDFAAKLLEMNIPTEDVVDELNRSIPFDDKMRHLNTKLQTKVDDARREADALLDLLQTTQLGDDGEYDKDTEHGENKANQRQWNCCFHRVKTTNLNFEKTLRNMRLIP